MAWWMWLPLATLVAVWVWLNWKDAAARLRRAQAPAPADPLVPGTNPGAGDAALPSPQIPPKSPAPGQWQTDTLDLLLWADELRDKLNSCACGSTGWITITSADGTVTERACRNCLGSDQ